MVERSTLLIELALKFYKLMTTAGEVDQDLESYAIEISLVKRSIKSNSKYLLAKMPT